MTKEIIDYLTRDLMKQGKILKHSQKLRPLHTDFINNDESHGYRVTFVDGLDDPNNDPILVAKRVADKIEIDRVRELAAKFKTDGTLSNTELTEFIRLKLVRGK